MPATSVAQVPVQQRAKPWKAQASRAGEADNPSTVSRSCERGGVWRAWNTCSRIEQWGRLVDDEHGEHFRPAEARRWTEKHVKVGLYRTDPDTGRREDQLAWLRAEDVYRVLRPDDVVRR